MKTDQLENYFLLHNKNWVSGNDSVNLLFWGYREGNHFTPKLITINVAVGYNPAKVDCFELHNYMLALQQIDTSFNKLVEWAKNSFSTLPIYILGYPKLYEFQNSEWSSSEQVFPLEEVTFYFESLTSEPSGTMQGKHLKARIHELLGVTEDVSGTSKARNKSIHDYFMYWSRTLLSPNIVKFDCDGLFFVDGKTALVEIKRSDRPQIPRWCPYVDDAPNYQIQALFAKAIGAKAFLLHHEGLPKESTKIYYDGTEKVDFYEYTSINAEAYTQAKNSGLKYAEYLKCVKTFKETTVAELESIINDSFQGGDNG